MSEDRIEIQDSYDFSKNIENISLSTTYIYGLEQLMMFFIERMEDPSVLTAYFKKFEDYITGKINLEENPFTEEEAHLYTIFSLQQLLKAKAYEQNLNIEVNATVDQAIVNELFTAVQDGKFDQLADINKRMQDQINEQLS